MRRRPRWRQCTGANVCACMCARLLTLLASACRVVHIHVAWTCCMYACTCMHVGMHVCMHMHARGRRSCACMQVVRAHAHACMCLCIHARNQLRTRHLQHHCKMRGVRGVQGSPAGSSEAYPEVVCSRTTTRSTCSVDGVLPGRGADCQISGVRPANQSSRGTCMHTVGAACLFM